MCRGPPPGPLGASTRAALSCGRAELQSTCPRAFRRAHRRCLAMRAACFDRAGAGAAHRPCRMRTTGEETLVCVTREPSIGGAGASAVPPGARPSGCRDVQSARTQLRAATFVACVAAVGTVHAASNVVQYTYDAAGNIVAIQRTNPAPITIAGLAPTTGPIGTVVAITGRDSARPRRAMPSRSTAWPAPSLRQRPTSLTVAVPAGATTGRIAVTVAANTATSAQDFVVAAPGVPTIAGFTPAAGPSGTAVTVTGANFNADARRHDGQVEPERRDHASSVTTTQLAFAVPAATGSGGSASRRRGQRRQRHRFHRSAGAHSRKPTSSPTTRLVANGPAQSIGLYATGKYGVVLFDGSAGDWLSLHARQFCGQSGGSDDCLHDLQAGQHAARERHAVGRESLGSFACIADDRHLHDAAAPRASRRSHSTRGSRSTPSFRPTGRHWPSRGAPVSPRGR